MSKTLPPDVKVVGDPHMGRKFKNFVPLARRGEREALVSAELIRQLNDVKGRKLVVIVGDLFDKFSVEPEVVLFTYVEAESAALANPNVTYVYLKGNHDGSRDRKKKSSFDIFARMCRDIPNIVIVDKEPVVIGDYAFVPWDAFIGPKEMVSKLPKDRKYACIFTHNDTSDFGDRESAENLMAFAELNERTDYVVNGHVHPPAELGWDESLELPKPITGKYTGTLRISNIGSMLPFNFGEDNTGRYYTSLTLEEFNAIQDKSTLKDKAVRFILKEGEEVPQVDAMEIRWKFQRDDSDTDTVKVEIGHFDLEELFDEAMVEVSEPRKKEAWELIND